MKQVILFLFCVVCLLSCSSKDSVPKAIIQPDKMVDVMWDVMRVQFLSEEIATSDSSVNKEEEIKLLTNKVFKIHKTTSAKFDKSYDWYIKHPELMTRIFDSMQVQKQRIEDGPETLDEAHDPRPIKDRLKRKKNKSIREVE